VTKNEALSQLVEEVQRTPEEYWPALLQLIRTFREAVTLKAAEASFRQGWAEAQRGELQPIETLWDNIDAE